MDEINVENWTDARSEATSSERLRELYHSDAKVHSHLGGNPNTPIDILKSLARDDNEGIRFFVAKNPSTPADTLEILAHDAARFAGRYVRGSVGLNLKAPDSILELLAQDVEEDVRSDVAENLDLPIALLRTLAQDKSSIVRCGAARNRNAPLELLKLLSSDECCYVRRWVAGNPSTGPDILESLSRDLRHVTRTEVAGNHNTSASTLEKLFSYGFRDSDSFKKISDPVISAEAYENFVLAFAKNPNTPLHILKHLSDEPSIILGKALRNCIGRNPAWNELPPEHPSDLSFSHWVRGIAAAGSAMTL